VNVDMCTLYFGVQNEEEAQGFDQCLGWGRGYNP